MNSPSDPFTVAPSPTPAFDPASLFNMRSPVVAAHSVNEPSQRIQPSTAINVTQWFEKLSFAPDRNKAFETIAGILASHFGSHPIRITIGNKKPKRLVDHRLGWLSRDSDLWRDAAAHWNNATFNAQWHKTGNGESLIGFTDETHSSRKILIWIGEPEVNPSLLESIRQPLEVIARFASRLSSRRLSSWSVLLGHHPRLTIGIAVSIFFAVFCFPVRYPVECTAILEPVGERIVSAPFDAVLSHCHVRIGDEVNVNELLLELDGRPLRLERESLQAELDQATKEREVALASRRIADAQQAELKQKQLARRIQLLDDRLARLQVCSPIDGVVVSGDLEKFVGSPLETGQTLMEIAPLDRLAIEVEIPEMEIGYVSNNVPIRVRFAAAGGRSIHATLSQVSPAAEVREDKNVFVGRLDLEDPDTNLRPGMRGDATMYGPWRPFVWRVCRSAWERVLWWIGY
jgi:biotin carboxyl carrier protein